VTSERHGREGVTSRKGADARPARTKAGPRAARAGRTQVGEEPVEKGAASQIEGRAGASHAKPPRRVASSSQSEVRQNADEPREHTAEPVKEIPAPGAAATRARRRRAAGLRRRVIGNAPAPQGTEPQLQAITKEIRTVKTMLQQLVPPPRSTDTSTADTILEAAVNSLRRLLSELIEDRMEAVVRDLAQVRSEATSAASEGGGRAVTRLDQLLESLGALKFEARRFDAIDPLIHVAVEERHEEGIPDGVVLATVRPGFRSARGAVLCKAAVAVNRGA
jgi:molecular chaperone GrpE (heat shock protein)